jgi:hypothetical protein
MQVVIQTKFPELLPPAILIGWIAAPTLAILVLLGVRRWRAEGRVRALTPVLSAGLVVAVMTIVLGVPGLGMGAVGVLVALALRRL